MGTYDGRVDECAPTTLVFEQGEDEGDGGGSKQDEDELVLELLQNQLPQRSGRLLWDCFWGGRSV